MDHLINKRMSCPIDVNEDERGGIRIKIQFDYIYVFKREANGDTSYSKCIVSQIRDPVFHHMAIVASNPGFEERASDIDIDAVYFKNWDPHVYQDPNELEAEKLGMIVRKNKVQEMDNGGYHPHDLMSTKLRDHLESENRKALTFLKKDDDKLEILFKHYETIQSYQHAFEELIKKAKEYREQEE